MSNLDLYCLFDTIDFLLLLIKVSKKHYILVIMN